MTEEGASTGEAVGTNIVLTEIVSSLEKGDIKRANKQFAMCKGMAEGKRSSGKMVLTRLQGLGLIQELQQEELDLPDEHRLKEIVEEVSSLQIKSLNKQV